MSTNELSSQFKNLSSLNCHQKVTSIMLSNAKVCFFNIPQMNIYSAPIWWPNSRILEAEIAFLMENLNGYIFQEIIPMGDSESNPLGLESVFVLIGLVSYWKQCGWRKNRSHVSSIRRIG